jgi:hypothetical protein
MSQTERKGKIDRALPRLARHAERRAFHATPVGGSPGWPPLAGEGRREREPARRLACPADTFGIDEPIEIFNRLARDPGVPLLGSVALIGSETDTTIFNELIALRFGFNQAVNSITFNFGDAGGDDNGTVEIRAYSAGDMFDTFLGSVEDTYPAGFADGKSLTLNFAGADYFVARTFGTNNENSIYWDIGAIKRAGGVVAVPEPSTLAMMLAGLFGLGWALRPTRRSTV